MPTLSKVAEETESGGNYSGTSKASFKVVSFLYWKESSLKNPDLQANTCKHNSLPHQVFCIGHQLEDEHDCKQCCLMFGVASNDHSNKILTRGVKESGFARRSSAMTTLINPDFIRNWYTKKPEMLVHLFLQLFIYFFINAALDDSQAFTL